MPFRIPRSASPQGRCEVRIFLVLVLLFAHVSPAAAQDSDVYQLLARINALRQQNGLLPLDLSSILTASAQRHSEDMARTGNIDHTGSDGSSIESRIREAGYGHWRDFGVWGENIYGGQTANVDAAWNFWTTSQVHRANLLKSRRKGRGERGRRRQLRRTSSTKGSSWIEPCSTAILTLRRGAPRVTRATRAAPTRPPPITV